MPADLNSSEINDSFMTVCGPWAGRRGNNEAMTLLPAPGTPRGDDSSSSSWVPGEEARSRRSREAVYHPCTPATRTVLLPAPPCSSSRVHRCTAGLPCTPGYISRVAANRALGSNLGFSLGSGPLALPAPLSLFSFVSQDRASFRVPLRGTIKRSDVTGVPQALAA